MNNRTCRVPGCDAPVGRSGAGGWCPRHYQRWRRHGDPQAVARRRGPARRTPAQLFWAKVNRDGPVPVGRPELGTCWLWTATTRGGFGAFNLPATEARPRRRIDAHRFAYEQHVGPVPPGHELGHLCHAAEVERCDGGPECPHRACVNPAHLVPVSQATAPRGIAARHAAQTTCPQGHPYDHVTRQGRRRCRRCMREQAERYRATQRHRATHPSPTDPACHQQHTRTPRPREHP